MNAKDMNKLRNLKLSPERRREIASLAGKASAKKRFGGLTKKQRSDKARCYNKYRYGWAWSEEKKACVFLGKAFATNLSK